MVTKIADLRMFEMRRRDYCIDRVWYLQNFSIKCWVLFDIIKLG